MSRAAVVWLLAAACRFDGEIGDGYGGADAAVGDGVCGSLDLLVDDLDDDDAYPLFEAFSEAGVTVSEGGGNLSIAVAAGDGDPYGGYTGLYAYDLSEGALEVEVAALGGANTVIEVRNHLDQTAQLAWEDDQIGARVFGVADPGTLNELPFDPSWTHWRIAVANETMTWEVSADRTTWTTVHQGPVPFDVRHVRGVLAAGGQGAVASTARFASVNVDAPGGAFCGGDTLVDDFAAAPLEPHWRGYSTGACTIEESGGALRMGFDGVGELYCGVISRHLFDLSDSAVVIDSSELPERTHFVTWFQLVPPDRIETRVEITLDGDNLNFVNRIASVIDPDESLAYDPVAHRYWRLQGAGSDVELATSPDGADWTTRLTVTPGFALDRVAVNLGAGHYLTVEPAGAVTSVIPGVNAD